MGRLGPRDWDLICLSDQGGGPDPCPAHACLFPQAPESQFRVPSWTPALNELVTWNHPERTPLNFSSRPLLALSALYPSSRLDPLGY